MTSRKRPWAARGSRRSLRFQDTSESQNETQTSRAGTSKSVLDETQTKKAATSESQTPQQSSRSSERIKSALKTSRIFSLLGRTPGKSGRATSYRTPRLGTVPWQRVSARASVKKRDVKTWKKDLKGLLKRSMKLCNLSSLANFKYKDERLRVKYEKTLKQKVLEVYPSPLIVVKLTITSCLSWQSSVVDAVWLEVQSLIPGDTADQDRMVVVYSAWLIHTKYTQSSNLESVNWLPVMLYSGRELIHQVVVDWLQGSFGCYVARCGMRQSDLLWMAGICSRLKCRNSSHNLDDCKIEFNYLITPPCGTSSFSSPNERGRPRIMMKLLLRDVHEVWNRLVDSSSEEISLEELQRVMSAINSVTSLTSGFPSSFLKLQQVRTPCVALSNSGKVRLMCQHSMALVIHCFVDLFIQMASSYDPDDHMQDFDKEDTIAELNNNSE